MLLVLGVVANGLAHAQDYPAKNITLIVPYAAGGNGDIRGRQIGQKLAALPGKAVIIENKPGAGGNIGTDIVAKVAADGYTIGMGNFAPLAVNAAMFKSMLFAALSASESEKWGYVVRTAKIRLE